MDDGRDIQFTIWARWTPLQRLQAMGRISATVLALRDRRLRQLHPHVSDSEFRQLRISATLSASPSCSLPLP